GGTPTTAPWARRCAPRRKRSTARAPSAPRRCARAPRRCCRSAAGRCGGAERPAAPRAGEARAGARARGWESPARITISLMPPTVENAAPAIAVAGLRREYGERTALAGVDLELAAGETLVVLGPNGAGKTTLLRILATLLRPSAGEVRVLGCS